MGPWHHKEVGKKGTGVFLTQRRGKSFDFAAGPLVRARHSTGNRGGPNKRINNFEEMKRGIQDRRSSRTIGKMEGGLRGRGWNRRTLKRKCKTWMYSDPSVPGKREKE